MAKGSGPAPAASPAMAPAGTPSGAKKVRVNTFQRTRETRVHKGAAVWLSSPAMGDLLTKCIWSLLDCASLRGMETLEITHIRVGNVEGEKIIHLYPTHRNDPEGLELKRSGKKVRCNLGPTLESWDLALPLGSREKFIVTPDTLEGYGPTISFDLEKPVKKVSTEKSSKKTAQAASPGPLPNSAPATERATQTAPAAEKVAG